MARTLAEQHAKMERDVATCVRSHKMTIAKRKEFERLTLRALKRALQKSNPRRRRNDRQLLLGVAA